MGKHIADASTTFHVVNICPDFCEVDGEVVAYDIQQELSEEKADYAPHFLARGGRVLLEGSVVRGTVGNAGKGILSGVSEEGGHAEVAEGTDHFLAHGRRVARHGDEVLMNFAE